MAGGCQVTDGVNCRDYTSWGRPCFVAAAMGAVKQAGGAGGVDLRAGMTAADTTDDNEAGDDDLAAALRGEGIAARPDLVARATYHGIGPLLLARSGLDEFRPEARARAMWELRHRKVLADLLAALAAAGIRAVVMKGTALAYDLYPEPALRPRGDTDLLIAPATVTPARAVLRQQGFQPFFAADAPPDANRSQEPWQLALADGSTHDIDLHWQPLNGAALAAAIPVAVALAEAVPLPRLAVGALALARPTALLHACLHRASHIISPYFIGTTAHYGGDRLIWLQDIDLLVRALTPAEWQCFLDQAAGCGAGPVGLAALRDAARRLHSPVPPAVLAQLQAAPAGAVTDYLLRQGRIGRLWSDLRALGIRRALRHGRYRLFPPAEFVHMSYPNSRLPLGVLYLRRLVGFLLGKHHS